MFIGDFAECGLFLICWIEAWVSSTCVHEVFICVVLCALYMRDQPVSSVDVWMDGCVCVQEYLKLSDVYKMYGNGCFPAQTASSAPNALCLPLAVTPDAPREVWLLQSFIPDRIIFCLFCLLFPFEMPFSLSLLRFSALIFHDAVWITHLLSSLFILFTFLDFACYASWLAFMSFCFWLPTMPSLYLLCVCVVNALMV